MVEIILASCVLFMVLFVFGKDFFGNLLEDFYEHRREMKELDQEFERERLGGVGELFPND